MSPNLTEGDIWVSCSFLKTSLEDAAEPDLEGDPVRDFDGDLELDWIADFPGELDLRDVVAGGKKCTGASLNNDATVGWFGVEGKPRRARVRPLVSIACLVRDSSPCSCSPLPMGGLRASSSRWSLPFRWVIWKINQSRLVELRKYIMSPWLVMTRVLLTAVVSVYFPELRRLFVSMTGLEAEVIWLFAWDTSWRLKPLDRGLVVVVEDLRRLEQAV